MTHNIQQFIDDAMTQRMKIIDDFCKVYLASRADFFKANPKRLERLELVQRQMSDGLGSTYTFRVKSGQAKKHK